MRRANGEGSIFKLSGKRRKPWAIRVTVGWTREGKQKYKYVSYHISKTEAKAALRDFLVNPTNKVEKHTFATVYAEWVEKAKLKPGTMTNHNSAFNRLEILHKKQIDKITLGELEDAISEHLPTAQRSMRKTIRNIFKHAMKYGYVDKNPSEYLEIEQHTKVKEINIFTAEEIEELWKNVGTEYFDDMPLLLLYTGLRISELLNTKIKDVDLDKKTINIPDSKTPNGIRLLPIHDRILPLIEKRYNAENEYLFLNPTTGRKQAYANFIKNYWTLEHTRHEARHTFVTQLTKCVDDRVIIKQIVGHSKKTDITDHYTHRSIEEVAAALNRLEYK